MAWIFASGLLVGGGVWLLLARLMPASIPLAQAAARLHRPGVPTVLPIGSDTSLAARLGRLLLPRMDTSRVRVDRIGRDLAVAGVALDVHLGRKILWSLLGGLVVPLTVGLLALGGTAVPISVPAWLAILGAVGGFVLPDFSIRQIADERRAEFRQCLGAYIDLVVMLLAANEGVTGALEYAAASGDSWPFHELRRALAQARLTATTPWQALAELGSRYAIPELGELAGAAQLSGSQGASVRLSLIAKAGTLRDRALSAEEAEAEQTSTRMVFPLLLLVLSFVLFVGYPAIVGVLNG